MEGQSNKASTLESSSNRNSPDNLVENLLVDFEYEVQKNHIYYIEMQPKSTIYGFTIQENQKRLLISSAGAGCGIDTPKCLQSQRCLQQKGCNDYVECFKYDNDWITLTVKCSDPTFSSSQCSTQCTRHPDSISAINISFFNYPP